MLQATISGPPGSGTSTLVEGIRKNRNWTSLNGGEVFRLQAKERGLTVEEFSELCREDLDVDRLLDEQLKLSQLVAECPNWKSEFPFLKKVLNGTPTIRPGGGY